MALQVGDMAPEFELVSDTGAVVRLADLRGKRVVLYFYPEDDTPGCTLQSCNFRDAYPRVTEKNAVVLGVSPDGVESHQKFKSKFNLPFPLLVDADHRVATAYGAWGPKKNALGMTYEGMIRSHFVIDETGRLVDVHIKVDARESVRLALESLQIEGV